MNKSMAPIEESFESVCARLEDTNVIGSAYGPQYSSGLSANGLYNVYRDPETGQMYIGSGKREYLEINGCVVGNKGKSYRIRFHTLNTSGF